MKPALKPEVLQDVGSSGHAELLARQAIAAFGEEDLGMPESAAAAQWLGEMAGLAQGRAVVS